MSRLPTGDEIFSGLAASPRQFDTLGDGWYRLSVGYLGIQLEIDRLRRDRDELFGELRVLCDLPGARTYAGNLLAQGSFNVSSIRARDERARYLAQRANTRTTELDWTGLLEDLCQRVLAAERTGLPSVSLRDLPKPAPDDAYTVEGLTLLKRHPVMIFGDGGTFKSYLALYTAGRLVKAGVRVGLFDWELCGEDHRERLECLFGSAFAEMDVRYVRCERPLVYEADRLRRLAKTDRLDYAIFDSVAFACDGPPEAAEVAGRYYRAVRHIGIGSLHIAHITKAENGDQRPFGSTFWHNGARATWFMKLTSPDTGISNIVHVGLFPRKANLGPLRQALGFQIEFGPGWTLVERADVADVHELASGLSLPQRMAHLLKRGKLTMAEIADELEAKVDTVEKAVKRNPLRFTRIPGPDGIYRIGLLETRQTA